MIVRLLLLLFVLVLTGCSTTPDNPDDDNPETGRAKLHYQLGVDALNKGNLPKAFEELLAAEKIEPNNPDTLDAIALAWRMRGELAQAENYYRKAVRNHPSSATYNNFGSLLMQMNNPKEAEKWFREALEDPRYVKADIAAINLGDALLVQNRLDEAIAAYRQAKILNPQQNLSRIREAEAFQKNRRYDFAKAIYETLLRENPTYLPALQGLVQMQLNGGRSTLAIDALQRFLDRAPAPVDRRWAEQKLLELMRK